ncbi:tumor necrosis factor receptor superfamily member 5-like [Styela clava]
MGVVRYRPFRTEVSILLWIIVFTKLVDAPPVCIVQKSAEDSCGNDGVFETSSDDLPDWCCLCPAGSYMVKKCPFGIPTETECLPCPFDENDSNNQTYTEVENNRTECSKSNDKSFCDKFMKTHYVAASRTQGSRCECNDGFHRSNKDTDHACYEHSPCVPGFQPRLLGNATMDTECEKCPNGKFSNVSSSIQLCVKFKRVQNLKRL